MWQPSSLAPPGQAATLPPEELAPMYSTYGAVAFDGDGDAGFGPGPGAGTGGGDESQDFAKRALAIAKADLVVSLRDLPALLMPWGLFCACLVPTAMMREPILGDLGLALSVGLGLGFLLLSTGRSWQMLAVTCLAAAALGECMGQYDRHKYLLPYHIYERTPFFHNVIPAEQPIAYREAGYLGFSSDTHVDTSRGLGYQSGSLYCVAPIVGASDEDPASSSLEAVRRIGFWAVGQDCCQERGLFRCGDVLQKAARGGLVVQDFGIGDDVRLRTYELAARAAAQTYGLMLPEQLVFVEWGRDPHIALDAMYSEASDFANTSVFACLVIVPVFAILLSCVNLSLTQRQIGREDRHHFHPETVEQMRYGIDLVGRRYGRDLQLDLLHMRCYWSGEVILDYAFHLANKHMYIGCLFSHPAHPHTKSERIAVCIIVTLLAVFTTGAVSVCLGDFGGLTRFLFIAAIVTLPPSVLKLQLAQIAEQAQQRPPFGQQSPSAALEDGQGDFRGAVVPPERREENLRQSQAALFTGAGVATVLLAIGCAAYIGSATEMPLGQVLWSSCDVVGYAFILEPLIDLVAPYLGTNVSDRAWTLGFFGRWCTERDAFAAAATGVVADGSESASVDSLEAAKVASAGKSSRRPLFRGLGAELLFGGKAGASTRPPAPAPVSVSKRPSTGAVRSKRS